MRPQTISSTTNNPTLNRLARHDNATASQLFNLLRWVIGGAIIVFTASIIIWEHKTLDFRYTATLEDTFPHFVQERLHRGINNTNNGDIDTNISGGSRVIRDDVMQYYRTPTQILQSPQLPQWVKEYVEWHAMQRQRYLKAIRNNSTPPDDIRFLISRCLANDKCGGASDRLQDMPYNIMLANQTNRVLLIKWEKPARLEHYLIPPEGGIDWTIPDGMFKHGDDWHLRGNETGPHQIVSTIRRDSAAPIFRKYEVEDLGYKM